MSMDKYRGETSRQSPDSEDFLVQINDSLANLEEVENEGVKLINLINEHHDRIQHAGYAAQDVKEKLESLYRDAIKQASREEEMDKKITKDIDKYLESIKDSRTPSDLNTEESHKKKRSQENTSVNNKAKKPKVSQSKSSIIKNGTSVAAKQPKDKDIEENWILATVVGYKVESKSYEVEDADKDEASNRPGERFIVPVKNVIAIPNPGEMRSPEFPKDSTVIALYPHTTCFYKAVVVIPPSKLTPKTSRYLLTFEDDENAERYVDAHYVLDIPKDR